MNTSLTLTSTSAASKRSVRPSLFSTLIAFFTALFSRGDDPAAVRYAAGKYGGMTD
jgi:hypothetical protein